MNHKSNLLKVVSVLAVTFSIGACTPSDKGKNDNSGKVDTTAAITKEKSSKAKKVFATIPSPVETAQILKDAGAKYNPAYLNNAENASKYSTVKAKALNLGIYGSDLSFISLFDQTQESLLYLKCTNTLATGLGITGAFDDKTTTKIQDNMDKKDSLIAIINRSYWTADNYLVDNGQPGVSSMIVAGGWIEGLYIATRVANATKSEAISSKIVAQKTSLGDLIDLLDSYQKENADSADILKGLKDLKTVFDGIPDGKLSDDNLKSVSDKAAELRNKITKL
jgi:hypothetical protein